MSDPAGVSDLMGQLSRARAEMLEIVVEGDAYLKSLGKLLGVVQEETEVEMPKFALLFGVDQELLEQLTRGELTFVTAPFDQVRIVRIRLEVLLELLDKKQEQ